MGMQKVQKQGRDKNTRRLPYYRKLVVKKDYSMFVILNQHVQVVEFQEYSIHARQAMDMCQYMEIVTQII